MCFRLDVTVVRASRWGSRSVIRSIRKFVCTDTMGCVSNQSQASLISFYCPSAATPELFELLKKKKTSSGLILAIRWKADETCVHVYGLWKEIGATRLEKEKKA